MQSRVVSKNYYKSFVINTLALKTPLIIDTKKIKFKTNFLWKSIFFFFAENNNNDSTENHVECNENKYINKKKQ